MYQVAYEGQIITDPISFEDAHRIAADENADAMRCSHAPLAEVVIARRKVPVAVSCGKLLFGLTAIGFTLFLAAPCSSQPKVCTVWNPDRGSDFEVPCDSEICESGNCDESN